MKRTFSLSRISFMVVAGLVLAALGLNASNWWRAGAINWPAAVNMTGLLLLMLVGAVAPESRRTRLAWNLLAAALVFPSTALICFR